MPEDILAKLDEKRDEHLRKVVHLLADICELQTIELETESLKQLQKDLENDLGYLRTDDKLYIAYDGMLMRYTVTAQWQVDLLLQYWS